MELKVVILINKDKYIIVNNLIKTVSNCFKYVNNSIKAKGYRLFF